MEKLQSEYRTKDLAEASFLLTKNIKFLRLERVGKTCWFVFNDKNNCELLTSEFWFGNATVPAKAFYDAVQILKNRIFTQ
jgi:hypothetical protein